MKQLWKWAALAALALAPVVGQARLVSADDAQSVNSEIFVQPPVKGFVEGYRTMSQGMPMMVEIVPRGETVQNWTQMITLQQFNRTNQSLRQSYNIIKQGWVGSCGLNSTVEVLEESMENGYPMLMYMGICPHNPQTNKPEFTFFKAIQGDDYVFMAQRAFRFQPNSQQAKEVAQYFAQVYVCNPNDSKHPCPSQSKSKSKSK